MSDEETNHSYKWIILIVFMFATFMTQMNWLSFAPISGEIENLYSVSEELVLLLTASFMILYIPMNFPTISILDRFGLKWGTGIGVILTGVFSLVRVLVADNFMYLMIAQIMIALGQPFLLNSFTKLAVNWFKKSEFAIATGIGTMSVLLGDAAGMFLTPYLFESYSYDVLLWVNAIGSILALVLYLLLVRDKPEGSSPNEKVYNMSGVKELFKNKSFDLVLILIFAGLGSFNAISTEVDNIFDRFPDITTPGNIAGVMILGGIMGAGILSTISDMKEKRVIFLRLAMLVAIPSTLGLVLIENLILTFVVAFIFGFFLVSALPIGLIYAVEITEPITEEASNGVMMTIGQIAGIILLISFNMYVCTGLFVVAAFASFNLKDR